MKLHKILKSLTDAQLDKLMEIMDKYGFSVAGAMTMAWYEIMGAR